VLVCDVGFLFGQLHHQRTKSASIGGHVCYADAKSRRLTYNPKMSTDATLQLKPGQRVRITQQLAARHYSLSTPVEGIVVKVAQKPTGSWFAHSATDKLWLDRVVLRKSDGEISTLNLDEFSHVEILEH